MKFQAEFDINIEEIKKNQPQMAADEIESYAASCLNNSGDGITLRDLRRAPLHLHPNGDMPDICPVCGWEKDKIQEKYVGFAGGANRLCLAEAREIYRETGYSDDHLITHQ